MFSPLCAWNSLLPLGGGGSPPPPFRGAAFIQSRCGWCCWPILLRCGAAFPSWVVVLHPHLLLGGGDNQIRSLCFRQYRGGTLFSSCITEVLAASRGLARFNRTKQPNRASSLSPFGRSSSRVDDWPFLRSNFHSPPGSRCLRSHSFYCLRVSASIPAAELASGSVRDSHLHPAPIVTSQGSLQRSRLG